MSDETFKVGEIGILQHLTNWPGKYNGEEAEVVGPLELRRVKYIDGGFGYCPVYIVSMGGENVGVLPENLRKKRPPQTLEVKEQVLEVA